MDLMHLLRSPDPSIAAARKLARWSAMVAALFWSLVFRLGAGSGLPDFVYVNF